jgi:putative MFS transporter
VSKDSAPGHPPWWFKILFAFVRSPAPLSQRQWQLLGLLGLTVLINHYDFAVLSLALPQIQAGLAIPEDRIGTVMATVRMGVVPALLFAFLADRVGRRRLLVATILGFTVCTVATAFTRSAAEFTALQFCARMFIAAEDMLAIVVITEELEAESRGFGIGILGAFGALGFGVAALSLAVIEALPFGWRALYLVGAVPLLWLAWLRRRIPETRRFEAERELRRGEAGLAAALGPLRDLVRRYPRRMLALCAAVLPAALVTITAGGFVSKHLQTAQGWRPGQVTLLYAVAGFLVFVSTVVSGRLGDRFGRRGVMATALLLNAVGVACFYQLSGGWIVPAWILFTSCGVAIDVLFGALGSELFPTSYRSTASGVRAAVGTVGGALGLLLESLLYPLTGSHSGAITWMLALAWIAPLVVLLLLPETARRELEEISPPAPPAPGGSPGAARAPAASATRSATH